MKDSPVFVRLFITFIIFFISWSLSIAQTPERCYTTQKMQEAFLKDPAYKAGFDKNGLPIMPHSLPEQGASSSVVTIPVHVIIVHPPGQAVGTGSNLSMDHIESQITVLNEDFRRMNADAANMPPEFPGDDSMIEFCLASVDPSGNPTDGVTRYATNQNLSSNEFAIKSATGWDRNQYLNIWVGPNLGGVLGWAYVPNPSGLPNPTLDGAVVATSTFGGPGYATGAPYNLGRTATHEIGHYLGLFHVWGNGGGGCGVDDNISDTPVQDAPNYGCPSHPHVSCGSNDMFMNYMDYVNDACMNSFSTEQGDYMNLILSTSRSSLNSSAATNCSLAPPLSVEILSITDALCFGESSGAVEVAALGGAPGFLYSIDNGPTQASGLFTNLFAGPHIISIQDANGTIATIDVTISEPPLLSTFVTSQLDPTCFDSFDGVITANGQGGTGAYTYSINNGGFSPANTFFNLPAGAHIISIADANGCISTTSTVLQGPPPITPSVLETTPTDCYGEENGEILVVGSGGTPTYSYSLDDINYQNNGVFTSLDADTFDIYIRDASNCLFQLSNVVVDEPDSISLSVAVEGILCFGDSSGQAILNAEGGTPGYAFAMDTFPYQSDTVFEGLTPGAYTFSVLDTNGCTSQFPFEIAQPDTFYIDTSTISGIDCFGDTTGTLFIQAGGGMPGYEYNLNNDTISLNTGYFNNLSAGVYALMVSDSNGCQIMDTFQVIQNEAITITNDSVLDLSCAGTNDGFIQLSAEGGSGEYSFSLNGGPLKTDNFFENLSSDTFLITIQDTLNCSQDTIIQINEPETIEAIIESSQAPLCADQSNGSLQISASGGTGILEYTIDTFSNTSGLFENLSPGSYSVEISDQNGCSQNVEATLDTPAPLSLSIDNQTDADCGASNASIQVSGQGGAGDYTYNLNSITNTTGQFETLASGIYTLVLSDANNCQDTTSIEILSTDPLSLEAEVQEEISCFGEENADILVSASGGTGNYTFDLDGETNSTGLFEGLAAGSYIVAVADDNGCAGVVELSVAQPANLTLEIENAPSASCEGGTSGSFSVNGDGGTGSLIYTLDGNQNTDGQFDNLSTGTYTVFVNDANNCVDSLNVEIVANPPVEVSEINSSSPSCNGESNGSLQLAASGGNGDYTYQLGSLTNSEGLFENLSAGLYDVVVTDADGCSGTLETQLLNPPALQLNLEETNSIECSNQASGSLSLSAEGGNGDYTFTLNGNSNNTGTFEQLAGGDYQIILTDANNCTDTLETSIEQSLPVELEATLIEDVNCNGGNDGQIQLNAISGQGPFDYQLNGENNNDGLFENLTAGDYQIILTDSENCQDTLNATIEETDPLEVQNQLVQDVSCNGLEDGMLQFSGNGGESPYTYQLGGQTNTNGIFENLASANYDVVLTDANNCTDTLNISVNQNDSISLETDFIQNVSCTSASDGAVQFNALGGEGPYNYQLSGQNNASGLFEALPSNNYTLEVSDQNGCIQTLDFTIEEPEALELQMDQSTAVACSGEASGSLQFSASGGSGNYTYSIGNTSNNNGLFENLEANTYLVMLTDENNCQDSLLAEIETINPINISVNNIQAPSCFGSQDASVQINANGGAGDFTFNLNTQENNTGLFNELAADNYNIIVTDANGCTQIESIEILAATPLVLELVSVSSAGCQGANNGAIQLSASGGTSTYDFQLNGSSNLDGVFENLTSGFYQAYVYDVNNCVDSLEVEINETSTFKLDDEILQEVSCSNSEDGIIEISVNGISGNFTYNTGSLSNETGYFENLEAGTYEFIVSDDNGCTSTTTVTLDQPEAIEADLEFLNTIKCYGDSAAILYVQASGGNGGFNYTLADQNNNNGLFFNLPAGTYPVSITDSKGCLGTANAIVSQPDSLSIQELDQIAPLCHGENNGVLTVEANGGNMPYIYSSGNQANSNGQFANIEGGFHPIFVVDQNGCTTTSVFFLEEPEVLTLEIEELTNANCAVSNTGGIVLNGEGGTPDFQYSIDNQIDASGQFNDLPPGNYTAVLTDANGCESEIAFDILLTGNLNVATQNISMVSCYGYNDGAFQLSANGGDGSYTYTLDTIQSNTTGSFEELAPGIYPVSIDDGTGCTVNTAIFISEPEALEISQTYTNDPNCYGETSGNAQFEAIGGSPDYSFYIDTEYAPDGYFEDLSAGDYAVLVLDKNNCADTLAFSLSQPDSLSINFLNEEPDSGLGDGTIDVEAQGGTPPYMYSLDGSNYSTSGQFTNLPTGTYTIYIQDANGCIMEVDATVELKVATSITNNNTSLNLYPNPFTDFLIVEGSSNMEQEVGMKIFSVSGILLQHELIQFINGKQRHTIRIDARMPGGCYFVELSGSFGKKVFKLFRK